MPTIPDSFTPSRILVCQQRQLGDVLLTTPALELLRRRYPEAAIHVLTEKKCLPMLANNPHVDHVWPLDKKALPTLMHEVRWYWSVARTGYDLVINFQPTLPRLRWVVGFSGATVRLTSTPPWYLKPLYTHTFSPGAGYAPAMKAALLEPLGIEWHGERPKLYLTDHERSTANALLDSLGLQNSQTLITLDPTHRQPTRLWPVGHYARMVARLAELAATSGLDLRFLPLWGPGEDADVTALANQIDALGHRDALLLPDSLLDLRTSAACMERASLHIGNCSAPRHMAVAVGTPTCVIQGSTGPEWTCPACEGKSPDHVALAADMDCRPCEENSCRLAVNGGSIPCLEALSPDTVSETAFAMLSATG